MFRMNLSKLDLMKTQTLKKKILSAFAVIIMLLAGCIVILGFYIIKKSIFERTQLHVIRSLDSARAVYEEEINRIGMSLRIAKLDESIDVLRNKLDLDYLFRIPAEHAVVSPSEIVRAVASKKHAIGGSRIIGKNELTTFGDAVENRSRIVIQPTEKAHPTTLKLLETAMAKEYALPILSPSGEVLEVVYGGRVVNQDYVLVDRIRKLVFGDELYKNKPVGTVTIFQDDVRISTNVLDENDDRAIGTRVSAEVYDAVVDQGQQWLDRAYVVKDWYKSAYEPIRNIDNTIIGILYVGVLEDPYNALAERILIAFVVVILLASLMAFFLSIILAKSIFKPIEQLRDGTRHLATGNCSYEVQVKTSILEMDQLAASFNDMSMRIQERENSIKLSNEKLENLNKSYLDLLGFVAHELKGLLSSTVINAYSIRDGYLGLINFKQKKAVDSICRNLDFLDATVKKFLNLSRIERGKLDINRTEFLLNKDVFEISIQTFTKLFNAKKMQVDNQIDPALKIKADMDLMQIVANNLVNNAAKYGTEGGQVRLSVRDKGAFISIDIYNDSRPIDEVMASRLFKKFSRLDVPEKKQVKGTGLGLYITKQIVEAHGGAIRVEPREKGNSFIFTIAKE